MEGEARAVSFDARKIMRKLKSKKTVRKILGMERPVGRPQGVYVHPEYGVLVNVMGVWVDEEGNVYVFDEEKFDFEKTDLNIYKLRFI